MEHNIEEMPREATILVVEDNAAARLALETVVEALGYRVLTAGSAEEALAVFQAAEQPIDLLMTDLILPGMQGPELYQQLRRQRPNLHCLVMSGYPLEEERERLERYGISDWLQKPFGMQEVSARLRAILGA